jgi:hypothetical protein
VAAISLFIGAFAHADPSPNLSDEVCDNTSKLYLEHEGQLKCEEILPVRTPESDTYRAMCFGCDPQLQYFGDAYNATNQAFSERSGSPVAGGELNRIPSTKSLLNVIRPGIDGRKCRDDQKYAAANQAACADLRILGDAFYAATGSNPLSQIAAAEGKLREANDQANAAVIKAIKKGKGSDYTATCGSENGRVEKIRGEYNSLLGKAKDQLWTNVLAEVGLKRGCVSHYVDEFPEFWCDGSSGKGEKSSIDKDLCLKKLSEKPADMLAKFKLYSSDLATMLRKEESRKRRLLASEKAVNKPEMKPIEPIVLEEVQGSKKKNGRNSEQAN